jgi:hypothetical protein
MMGDFICLAGELICFMLPCRETSYEDTRQSGFRGIQNIIDTELRRDTWAPIKTGSLIIIGSPIMQIFTMKSRTGDPIVVEASVLVEENPLPDRMVVRPPGVLFQIMGSLIP